MDPWRLIVFLNFLLFAVGPGWLRKRGIRAKIGRDPVLVQPRDTPHGCAQAILGGVIVGYYLLSSAYAFWPAGYGLIPAFGYPPFAPPDAWRTLGATMAFSGLALCWIAQGQMGLSWRFGPDRDAPPPLVTERLFAWVRNPVYAAIMLTLIGELLLMPDAISLALLCTGLVALHMLVRLEEAFLLGVHGEPFREYARRVPRFVPGLPGSNL